MDHPDPSNIQEMSQIWIEVKKPDTPETLKSKAKRQTFESHVESSCLWDFKWKASLLNAEQGPQIGTPLLACYWVRSEADLARHQTACEKTTQFCAQQRTLMRLYAARYSGVANSFWTA